MALQLEVQSLSREVQRPLEQIAKKFPLQSQDYKNNSVGPAALLTNAVIATNSADLTVTATTAAGAQDVASATITTAADGIGTFAVIGVFDFDHTGAGAGVALGQLRVDGTAQNSLATLSQSAVRATVTQIWLPTLAAGSKVIKLQAWKTVGAGTLVTHQTHTQLIVVGPF